MKHRDCWRVNLSNDGAAKVTPLKVFMKPDAVAKRTKARRYPKVQMDFIRNHVEELERAGCIRKNPLTRWSSPILVVPKPGKVGEYRLVIDVRWPNSQITPIAPNLPILEVVLMYLEGAKFFASLDAFKGFWQFPLHEESQELYSFLTDKGCYTPTRIVQGSCDATTAFQAGMMEALGDLMYNSVLLWVDDLLAYAKTFEELVEALDKIFTQMRKFNIKLNPKKSDICKKSVEWCGRSINEEGVRFKESYVTGLTEIKPPENGAQLQQFICV